MNPDRGLRRSSVSSTLTGDSMIRAPIGSMPASAPVTGKNIPPAGLVFGTVSLSTTLIQGVAGIAEKYFAATLMSSSVIDLANPAISAVLPFRGSEVFRAPFLKSVSCCTMYSNGAGAAGAAGGGIGFGGGPAKP